MAWECPTGFETYRDVLYRFSDVRWAGKWCKFRCLMGDRHRHQDSNWSGIMWIGNAGELVARCLGCGAGFKEFVAETGTDARDWFPRKSGHHRGNRMMTPSAKLVATYRYCGAEGQVIFEKQRFEPGFDGRGKSLRFRRPMPHRLIGQLKIPPGKEAWVYGIQAQEYGRKASATNWDYYPIRPEHQESIVIDQVDPILYRLPELLSPEKKGHPVFVTEGEKDCDLLRSLGFVAVCGPYGSSQWLPQWADYLVGRRVVVVPDNNHVGETHADAVAGSCMRRGAESVRVVRWDDGLYNPGEGGGVGNWLPLVNKTNDKTVGRNAVVDIVSESPEYSRPKKTAA